MAANHDYVIPTYERKIKRASWLGLAPLAVLPTLAFSVGAVSRGLNWGLEVASGVFFVAVPISIVLVLVLTLPLQRRMRRSWKEHSYAWYRATFPEHVHADGRVSCRHCKSRQVHVRNLMNRTFTRAHFCTQCGETLYFSPEKL